VSAPAFPPVPVEWQQACGDVVTSWAQVEFALHLVVLNLRWHRNAPAAKHDPRRYSTAPRALASMTKEIRQHMPGAPLFQEEWAALAPLLDAGKPLAAFRNDVAHSVFVRADHDGHCIIRKPEPATRFVYSEFRLALSEIHSRAALMRQVSESISSISESISRRMR
jgi:hypothetical protein